VKEVGSADLGAMLTTVRQGLVAPARLYLVAGTSHLAEGWRGRVPSLELAGETGATALAAAVREASAALELAVVWESPADVIPLPAGWAERARPVPPEVGGVGGGRP